MARLYFNFLMECSNCGISCCFGYVASKSFNTSPYFFHLTIVSSICLRSCCNVATSLSINCAISIRADNKYLSLFNLSIIPCTLCGSLVALANCCVSNLSILSCICFLLASLSWICCLSLLLSSKSLSSTSSPEIISTSAS